jgi:leucyl/phenylalanyl-tRNA--protein transferase
MPLRLHRLDRAPEAPFPPVASALDEPDGLLAFGGDLSPARLLNAYRHGIFPWYSEGEPILWWTRAWFCRPSSYT